MGVNIRMLIQSVSHVGSQFVPPEVRSSNRMNSLALFRSVMVLNKSNSLPSPTSTLSG